jgi:S-adenosylmethionine hydrolase
VAIVTLTTDFGLKDPWVGSLKGVLLSIAPDALLVDLTHEIPRHAVRAASYVLASTHRYFPAGTVHLVVVDPGVGGSRRAIACAAGGAMFVGPDNGVFDHVFRRHPDARCVEITDPRIVLKPPSESPTFQGRDVFAPAAAWLARGASIDDLGPPVAGPLRLAAPEARRSGALWTGEVVWVDRFGNLISNIEVPRGAVVTAVRVGETDLAVVASYSAGDPRAASALTNSDGLIEVFVNRGDASRALRASAGTPVTATMSPADA